MKLEFAYDYMGRRIFKKVYNGETLKKHLSFVYDGYKLIEERNALDNNAAVRKYVWQPEALDRDVPLTVYDAASEKTYYYHTDANKNVTELSDESGNVVAHYEYSPFGSLTKVTGDYAENNPFRFSSEYFDEEMGLVYYNYRYYNPELGRWISRDPIEEQGGYNLYGMIGNNPLLRWDSLGCGHALWCPMRLVDNLKKSWQNTTQPFINAYNSFMNIVDNYLDNEIAAHYGRNEFNNVPENIEDLDSSFEELPLSKSVFHGVEDGNRKFVSNDGREAVYDQKGHLVTDSETLGTYNYYDPIKKPMEHFKNDVIPYYIWGNDPYDKTSFSEKLEMSIVSLFLKQIERCL